MVNYRLSSSQKFSFRQESMLVKERFFTLLLLFTFHFSLFTIQACGLDVEDPIPPSPPHWVKKSLPEEWPERGIDAHESGGIYLEWEAVPDEDIIAYKIYRAKWYSTNDSLGDYDLLNRLAIETSSDLDYIDREVQRGTRYYYKLKSEDSSGNQSTFSTAMFYLLLPQLPQEDISPNGLLIPLKENRQLNWKVFHTIELENYCLTLLSSENVLLLREILVPTSYISDYLFWQIPETIELEPNQTYRWRIDTGAQYIDGYDTSGSESEWATFLYVG
jgi:hypothetical protein